MLLGADLTELPVGVRRELHRVCTEEAGVALMQAKLRQARIAQFYHNNRPRSMEGIGGQTMAMDPYWINYWRMKLKYEPAEEEEVMAWLRRKEEWFRVRHTGTRTQVGMGSRLVVRAASREGKRKYWRTFSREEAQKTN